MIRFKVYGTPRPKQSFKMGKGGGYTPEHIKAWLDAVASKANECMNIHNFDMLVGPVGLHLEFFMPTKHIVDVDNLVKGVSDSLKHICYEDDNQVTEVHAFKDLDKRNPRVEVEVYHSDYGRDLLER